MFSVKDIAEYIVLLIAAFASRYQMTDAEAYRYLSRYGAIKVAHDFYDVMHTQPFDESVLTSGELRVLTFDGYTREWADFIFLNRNNKTYKPAHDYDIVYGPWKTHQDMTEPNVTPHEFKRLKEQLTARMIQILTEERGYTIEEAIDRVYTSPIYEKISDPNTGLFFQSPRYVLSYIN